MGRQNEPVQGSENWASEVSDQTMPDARFEHIHAAPEGGGEIVA